MCIHIHQAHRWRAVRLLDHALGNDWDCYTDNEATKETIEKPGVTARTKHFETWMQYCRERVLALEIIMQWIPTGDMLADIFTKSLDKTTYSTSNCAMCF